MDFRLARQLYLAVRTALRRRSDGGLEIVRLSLEASNGQARLLRMQGQYRRAEALHRAVLQRAMRVLGPDDALLIEVFNDLGILYKQMARLEDAGQMYSRCLTLLSASGRADPCILATLLHNLGGLEHSRGNHVAGEPFARRSWELRERALGPDHPEVAADMAALAALLEGQGKFEEAEALYHRALSIFEATLGSDHYECSVSLNNLAAIAQARGEIAKADGYYSRALAIKLQALGPNHPELATTLNNLGVLREQAGDFTSALDYFGQALRILEVALPFDHPHRAACRSAWARVSRRFRAEPPDYVSAGHGFVAAL